LTHGVHEPGHFRVVEQSLLRKGGCLLGEPMLDIGGKQLALLNPGVSQLVVLADERTQLPELVAQLEGARGYVNYPPTRATQAVSERLYTRHLGANLVERFHHA